MTSDPPPPGPPRRRRGLRGAFFVAFGVVYGLWLVLGVFDSLVWMPQLIAPSVPLHEIYAVLTDAGSAPGAVAAPVLWFLFWAAAGLTYLVVFLPAHRAFHRIATSTSTLAVIGIGITLFGAMSTGSTVRVGTPATSSWPSLPRRSVNRKTGSARTTARRPLQLRSRCREGQIRSWSSGEQ